MINELQKAIIAIGVAVPLIKLTLDYVLFSFRKKIQVGDVVGVDFGKEVVLNRTIKSIKNNEEVVVLSEDLNYLKSIKLENIYLHTKYTPIDKGQDEEYAQQDQ